MGKMWYESHFQLRFAYFLPFIVLGAMILCFILEIRELKKKGSASEQEIKFVKIIFSGTIAFVSILIFPVKNYKNIEEIINVKKMYIIFSLSL